MFASVDDPVRVVVESGASSLLRDWGALVGVVVGAILGAFGQIVAGRLQRDHDVDREEVRVRRELYARVLGLVDDLETATADRIMSGREGDRRRVVEENKKIAASYNALDGISSEVAISGSLAAFEVLAAFLQAYSEASPTTAAENDREDMLEAAHATAVESRQTLVVQMRVDLGTAAGPSRTGRRRLRENLG